LEASTDRTGSRAVERTPSMSTVGTESFEPALRVGRRIGSEPGPDGSVGSLAPGVSVFRIAEMGGDVEYSGGGGESQTGATTDAADGSGMLVLSAENDDFGTRSSDLSVPFAWTEDRPTGSSLECGYYLGADADGLPVSGGDDRLVQPPGGPLAAVELVGGFLLSGDVGGRLESRNADDFPHRSRLPVHGDGLDESVGNGRGASEHGGARSLPRQHFCGTIVAECEVRRVVPEAVWKRVGVGGWVDDLLSVLQRGSSAPGIGVSDPGRRAW